MGWLAALLALGFNLLVGIIFVALGAVFATWAIQVMTVQLGATKPPFKRTWKISCLAFLMGLGLGSGLQWMLGGPSPLTAAIGIPLFAAVYGRLLSWKLADPFHDPNWRWRGMGVALLATLLSSLTLFGLMRALRWMLS